ncbi:ATP-binding protein [Streptomyces sp. ME02-8801-2C]|uniref:ATP-binding protein n=1 Tax=Streptomyces sp. ME02-8801-2C TaxID=3028680 RepID=UPI0029BA3192|nr:ATP-binding protein [Streptomyces sp. ME02-8801-2C]MDX3457295.1 ATP-binding protein [Streptomyces sp. ME02-8801-2C]
MSEIDTGVPGVLREADAPWEYLLYIPHDLRAVTVCRRTVRLVLTMHCLIRLADVTELLATELVSNGVRRTKGPVALRLHWQAGVLRVGVWDANPQPPKPPPSAAELTRLTHLEDGRGLALISSCANLWGWQPLTRGGLRGKYVWGDLVAG